MLTDGNGEVKSDSEKSIEEPPHDSYNHDMECYKCHTAMQRKALDGVLVDACPTCEGIWLDKGEFELLRDDDRKTIDELRIEAKKEIELEKRRLVTTQGLCPRCQKTSLEQKAVGGVELDVCPSCRGLYFDWGELSKALLSAQSSGFRALVTSIKGKLGLK